MTSLRNSRRSVPLLQDSGALCGRVLIPPSDAANAENGTQIFNRRRMHAWAEYYQDGIGWILVECTPGLHRRHGSGKKMLREATAKTVYLFQRLQSGSLRAAGHFRKMEGKSTLPAFLSDLLSKAFLPLIIFCFSSYPAVFPRAFPESPDQFS